MMYTQSPWKWHKRKHSNTHFLANENETDDDYKVIDDGSAYGEYGASIDVESANARLIAAAPELLEALTHGQIMDMADMLDWVADRLVYVHHEDENMDYIISLRERADLARSAIAKALGQ